MYEEKITEYKKSKEDLEISLNQNIVNFKNKKFFKNSDIYEEILKLVFKSIV
jgi:hypothetical protein